MTTQPVAAPTRMALSAWSALGVVYVLWGSTYLAIRYTIASMPPMLSAAARFSLAGLIALAAVRLVRGRAAMRASRTELGTAAASGLLLLVGGNGLVVFGEQRVASGLAALLVACVPLWVVVLRVLLRDRPAGVTLAGVLVGLVGVGTLLLPGGGRGAGDVGYAALLVLAGLSWSAGSLLTTRRPVPGDPFLLTAVQMLVAGVGLLVLAVARGELRGFSLGQVTDKSWLALGYLVVFGSLIGFTAYVWVLGRAPVSVVSTYAYVNPAVAVLLGVLVAGERLTGGELVGGLVILVAVALVVSAEGTRSRRAREGRGDPPEGVLGAPRDLGRLGPGVADG
ncbi:MAG TPA: EamA family transporter [Mycobacteriales bacterium]|nr:EamA family transporter [Mycobacteriales bacterium]